MKFLKLFVILGVLLAASCVSTSTLKKIQKKGEFLGRCQASVMLINKMHPMLASIYCECMLEKGADKERNVLKLREKSKQCLIELQDRLEEMFSKKQSKIRI